VMGAGMSAARMRIVLMVSVLMDPVLSTVAMLIRTARPQSAAHVSAISVKTQPVALTRTVRQVTVSMESVPVMSVSLGRPVQTMAAHQSASLTRTVLLTNGATPLRVSASQAAEQMITAQQSHAVHVMTTSVQTRSVALMMIVLLDTALRTEHVLESATKTPTAQQSHAVRVQTTIALTQSVALMMIALLGTALRMEHVQESATKTLTAQQSHVVNVRTTIALTQSVALMMIVLLVTVMRMANVRESAMMTLTANSSTLWSAVCVRTSSAQSLSAALMMIVNLALSAKTIPVSKKENVMQNAHVKVQMRSVTTFIPTVSGVTWRKKCATQAVLKTQIAQHQNQYAVDTDAQKEVTVAW